MAGALPHRLHPTGAVSIEQKGGGGCIFHWQREIPRRVFRGQGKAGRFGFHRGRGIAGPPLKSPRAFSLPLPSSLWLLANERRQSNAEGNFPKTAFLYLQLSEQGREGAEMSPAACNPFPAFLRIRILIQFSHIGMQTCWCSGVFVCVCVHTPTPSGNYLFSPGSL